MMASTSYEFLDAIRQGNVDRVRRILQEGQDVNAPLTCLLDETEFPIFFALQLRDDDMLELLLECGAHVNQVLTQGSTPLHVVACYSRPDRVSKAQFLLSHGAEVDSRNGFGSTPLHHAAYSGNDAVAELLIQNGADLNAVNRAGQTPLHIACNGKENLARLLIERGANMNAVDNGGCIPINYCLIGMVHEPIRLPLLEGHVKELLGVDNAHPGLWAQAFATVGHKKTPRRLSLLFTLFQQKPDLFGYLQQDQNPRKRKRSN